MPSVVALQLRDGGEQIIHPQIVHKGEIQIGHLGTITVGDVGDIDDVQQAESVQATGDITG
ncbi:Uncharacterised protein [Mycobacteroides abscessus subsp. abscessus]|nr:Uncharacterised protein [Mycobacteroides abscessus subsp. abscessus]